MGWETCLREERKSGFCERICQLAYPGAIQHEHARFGDIKFYTGKLVDYFATELGWKGSGGPGNKDAICEEIRGELVRCNNTHAAEIRYFSVFDRCDKWSGFLNCVDKALLSQCKHFGR